MRDYGEWYIWWGQCDGVGIRHLRSCRKEPPHWRKGASYALMSTQVHFMLEPPTWELEAWTFYMAYNVHMMPWRIRCETTTTSSWSFLTNSLVKFLSYPMQFAYKCREFKLWVLWVPNSSWPSKQSLAYNTNSPLFSIIPPCYLTTPLAQTIKSLRIGQALNSLS